MGQGTIDLDTVVRIPEDVLHRDLDGETVLVDLRSGTYFGLDPVGSCIWGTLDGRTPLRGALDAVTAAFDVDEPTAERDLLRLAGELLERGLLQPAA